ncbi:hypothetical protein NL676_039403 [Syzygium grande]|nr:hypothetical protein NL676_039403 [Syzygium grande]
MVIAVVIMVVTVALIGTMVVEVEVESALSVTSLGILRGSVPVKGAGEVGMWGGITSMGEEEVVVGAMVLIEMVIDLAGTIGIVVFEEDQEMTTTIRTFLVPVNILVQETSIRAKQLEVLLLLDGGVKVSSVASVLHGGAKMVIAVVIMVVTVALIGTMVVEVEVESALSVTSLGILRGSVPVKGAEEVGTIGIVVLEEDQEMTTIIGTFLVPVNISVQETSIRGKKNAPDSKAIGGTAVTCWRCQSLFCCISSSW